MEKYTKLKKLVDRHLRQIPDNQPLIEVKSMLERFIREEKRPATSTTLNPFMCTGDVNQVIIAARDEQEAEDKFRSYHNSHEREVIEVVNLYNEF